MDAPLPSGTMPPAGADEAATAAAGVGRRGAALAQVLLCSGFPTQLAVFGLLALIGLAPRNGEGELTLAFVAALSAIDSLLIGGLVVWFLKRGGESPARVLLGRRRLTREALLGLLLTPVVFLVVAVASLVITRWFPFLHDPDNPFASLLGTRHGLIVFALVGMIAGGLREEMQRAFILHRFEQHLGGAVVGLVGFSVLFGIGHALQGWSAVIITGSLGLLWGVVYLARRSIVAPVVSHATFNLVEVVGFGLLR